MSKKTVYIILLSSLLFIGCGSDSSGGGFSKSLSLTEEEEIVATEEQQDAVPDKKESYLEPEVKIGVLLDSVVSDLTYRTISEIEEREDRTNSRGEFEYYEGDKIEFSVGDIILGEIKAKEIITMSDFPYPIQVAQFLQTIDSDNFAENGIDITRRLRDNELLNITTPKELNSSLFAKELNIQDFDDSSKNNFFMKNLIKKSRLKYRKIVPELIASQHKEKSERLKNIKNNNSELYNQITNVDVIVTEEVNSTKELNTTEEINSTIKLKRLDSRLSYNFYQKIYREKLEVETEITKSENFSNMLATKYADNYLQITQMIIETILYTDNSQRDVKRKIMDNIKSIPNTSSSMSSATENCLSTISFSEDNRSKEAKKVTSCISNSILNSSINYIPKLINQPDITKQNIIVKRYLDLYFSCDNQEKNCLLNLFNNNSTTEDQIEYIASQNGIANSSSSNTYAKAKESIDKYKNTIEEFVQDISEGLPQDNFLNKAEPNEIDRVIIKVNPLKITKDEDTIILWVAIDIDNRSGGDINITSFEQSITIDNKVFNLSNSHKYTPLDQTYSASNKAINLITPLFIDDTTVPQEGEAKISVKMNYLADDLTFQTIAETSKSFNLSQLEDESILKEFNKKAISLSRNMEIVEERTRFYLPTVKLGFNRLKAENIEWEIEPKNIIIKSNVDGLYIETPALQDGSDQMIRLFKVSNKTDPYSQTSTFRLNITKRKGNSIERDPDEIIVFNNNYGGEKPLEVTLEFMKNNSHRKLASTDCVVNRWRDWRNMKFTLVQGGLANDSNIINSVQACMEVQQLVEDKHYSYAIAVRDIKRKYISVFAEYYESESQR